jgi:hypothetical protein
MNEKKLERELQQIEDARLKAFNEGDHELFDKLGEEGQKIESAIDQLTEQGLNDLESDPDSLFNI